MQLEKAMLIRLEEGKDIPEASTIQSYRESKEDGVWYRVLLDKASQFAQGVFNRLGLSQPDSR